jgi:hypothetical protein
MVIRASAAVAVSDNDSSAESFVASAIRVGLSLSSNQSGGAGVGTRVTVQQLALVGLVEFLPPSSATPLLTELLDKSHGGLDPAIRALALLKSPARVEGKDIPRAISEYVAQMRTGLFVGF